MAGPVPAEAIEQRIFSIDPAPPVDFDSVEELEGILMEPVLPLFQRMRALSSLLALATPEAIDALEAARMPVVVLDHHQPPREDGSALLRHECAYVMGQLRDPTCIPHLREALAGDPSPMVRHEAVESLGNIATDECIDLLRRALEDDPAVEVKESCEVALDNIQYPRDPDRF